MGIRVDQLPDGEYAAVERVSHQYATTARISMRRSLFLHMNHGLRQAASRHGGSTKCRWNGVSSPAVKLDFRHLPDGYVATPGDVEAELKRIGHT